MEVKKLKSAYWCLLIFLTAACSSSRTTLDMEDDNGAFQEGIASWYGPKFHGRQTANGERYDMDKFTAAHRTLPFNTYVEVVNQQNGRSVVVRINDRGPFAKGRIIDLSRAAAREIEMIGPGTAPVRLFIVSSSRLAENTAPPVNSEAYADPDKGNFTIQIASFESSSLARHQARTISGSRVEKVWVDGQNFYRIYYGNFNSMQEAEKQLKKLRKRGINGFVKNL